ncbi:MAG: pilus assembly protein PilP [Nitrospirae bacterium]|nr:pilus assembly protein PilP [Nitrospirota bacterium]
MKTKDKHIKFAAALLSVSLLLIPVLHGCKKKTPPAKPGATQGETGQPVASLARQPEAAVVETVQEEGYIYQPGDRRDPFVPLIVPTQKAEAKGTPAARLGTLESYDITEFALLAIAKKGDKYYALLITPDNRSFTVYKGSGIGLHKGRVEDISGGKVVLVEYSKDFRGDLRPKQIILELKER